MAASETNLTKIANNVLLLLFSRLAMVATPFVASLLVYLGGFYLEARFEQSQISINNLDSRLRLVEDQTLRLNNSVSEVNKQLSLTAQQVTITNSSWTQWQSNVNTRLEKMNDAINQLNSTVSALNATLKIIQGSAR